MSDQATPMSDSQIIEQALITGFAISTQYGQTPPKLMPISDSKTLISFGQSLTAPLLARIAELERMNLELSELCKLPENAVKIISEQDVRIKVLEEGLIKIKDRVYMNTDKWILVIVEETLKTPAEGDAK